MTKDSTNQILWQPQNPKACQMFHFMQKLQTKYKIKFNDYHDLHTWSIHNLSLFWQELAAFFHLTWAHNSEVLINDREMINAKWFVDSKFNFAQELLRKDDEALALISILEDGTRHTLSFKELRQEVANCAAAFIKANVVAGDRIAAILPNVSYTIITMLAAASIGAVWSSCSPDFGMQAIIDRFGQIQPKILITSNAHFYGGKKFDDLAKIPIIHQAIKSIKTTIVCPILAKSPTKIMNSQQWDDFIIPDSSLSFNQLPFNHPLYIMFSSGTTGKPKCIIHGAGGTLIQHLKELGLHTDLTAADRLFFYTTCGWMMWNWMVSALSLGTSLVLYDGSPAYPDYYRLFDIIATEKVSVFGTSAKFISALEKAKVNLNESLSLNKLRCILSTGSPLLPKNYDFIYQRVKENIQLCSISGGTDIISCFALGNPLLPVYRGQLQCIGLGMAVEIFNEEGKAIYEERGELVCSKAFPSMPLGFWNDHDQAIYKKAYFSRFPHVWAHGDFACLTKQHGLIIYGRSDTTLNPGGIRIGTAEIYRQIEEIPAIFDSVVIGQDWEDDIRIILFVKLAPGLILNEELQNKIKQHIRNNASPRHVPAKIIQVPEIPRTINGKVVELAVRQVVHGQAINNRESIANPEALEFFKNLTELKT